MTEQETQQIANFNAHVENMKAMNQIVQEMKEIPVLPSEEPKDTSILQKVEFPDSGGVLTYMSGYELPYRGFPYFEFVEKIDSIKKLGRAMLSGFYHRLKLHSKLRLLTLIPAAWAFKDLVSTVIYTFYRIIERFRIKPIRYSEPVREIYRAFGEGTETNQQIRDLVCMILENDNAYRFRFQDIVEELNQKAVKENPRKEIIRLLGIMTSRETSQEIRDTWKLMKLFVSLYLRFDKPMLQIVQNVLANLDVQKVKLAPEDIQFCHKRTDYVFGYMQQQETLKTPELAVNH